MAATAAVPATDRTAFNDRALVPTLVLVGLVVAVMSSLGAPLIPDISEASHVSLSAGEWLLTITLLTGALATRARNQVVKNLRKTMTRMKATTATTAKPIRTNGSMAAP